MHGHFNIWKATIGIVIYVAVCMLILCFSPPEEADTMATTPVSIDFAADHSGV